MENRPMKRRFFLIVWLSCLALGAHAQECIHIIIDDPAQIQTLTDLVSIDRIDGNQVTAYGNADELAALTKHGYQYTVATPLRPKTLTMATTVEQMRQWNCYPTYATYVALMQYYAQQYPDICRLDTIGTSVDNRLILCMKISDNVHEDEDEPEFLYSATIHGDELTGFYFMLRLIDTLLSSYSTNETIAALVNSTQVYINPLSNPDGTYHGSDNSVAAAQRYNANYVDLNRNFPDPFGSDPMSSQQPENTAMIDYLGNHHFLLSANLHGGSEVLNYPWDSFTSSQRPHPNRDWWIEVCRRYIDTVKQYSTDFYRDVNSAGYIAGGDWYVIHNGRQDYVNYYHNCREMTMEVSTIKKLSTDRLETYWHANAAALIHYISEVHALYGNAATHAPTPSQPKVYPNPTHGTIFIDLSEGGILTNAQGKPLMVIDAGANTIDLSPLPAGLYLYKTGETVYRIIKK